MSRMSVTNLYGVGYFFHFLIVQFCEKDVALALPEIFNGLQFCILVLQTCLLLEIEKCNLGLTYYEFH